MFIDLAETFSEKKLIKNKLLNIFGHHILRVLIAKIIFNFGKHFKNLNKTTFNFKSINENGYHLENNFLTTKDFKILKGEIIKIKKKKPKIISGEVYGNMIWKRYDLSNLINSTGDNFLKKFFLNNTKFKNLVNYVQGSNYNISYVYYDEIYELNHRRKYNETEIMHRDTFYDTFKAWFYINDIDKLNAPFTIIEGSHKLTLKKIFFEYTRSIFFKDRPDSFNLDKKNFLSRIRSKKIITNKNSFLLANTFCFHKKGYMKSSKIRKAINFNFKKNPYFHN